jgi:hypothetical protein
MKYIHLHFPCCHRNGCFSNKQNKNKKHNKQSQSQQISSKVTFNPINPNRGHTEMGYFGLQWYDRCSGLLLFFLFDHLRFSLNNNNSLFCYYSFYYSKSCFPREVLFVISLLSAFLLLLFLSFLLLFVVHHGVDQQAT